MLIKAGVGRMGHGLRNAAGAGRWRSRGEDPPPPGPSEGVWPCHRDFGLVELILDFWLPELREDTFLLF